MIIMLILVGVVSVCAHIVHGFEYGRRILRWPEYTLQPHLMLRYSVPNKPTGSATIPLLLTVTTQLMKRWCTRVATRCLFQYSSLWYSICRYPVLRTMGARNCKPCTPLYIVPETPVENPLGPWSITSPEYRQEELLVCSTQ